MLLLKTTKNYADGQQESASVARKFSVNKIKKRALMENS